MKTFNSNLYKIIFIALVEIFAINIAFAKSKIGEVSNDKFIADDGSAFPLPKGEWVLRHMGEGKDLRDINYKARVLINADANSVTPVVVIQYSTTSHSWEGGACKNLKTRNSFFNKYESTSSSLIDKCSAFNFTNFLNATSIGFLNSNHDLVVFINDYFSKQAGIKSYSFAVNTFIVEKFRGKRFTLTTISKHSGINFLTAKLISNDSSSEKDILTQWHADYMAAIEESLIKKNYKSFINNEKTKNLENLFASKGQDFISSGGSLLTVETLGGEQKNNSSQLIEENQKREDQKLLAIEEQKKTRSEEESNLASSNKTKQVLAASMWLPSVNLPKCVGSEVSSWNECIGVTYQQGKPYTGQFRNGSPYGQFEILANAETQTVQVNTLSQLELTQLNAQEKQRLENEKLREEATVAKQRQQELEEQLRQAQEARKKEQDRILAEQKATEQKRLFEESRVKEQQRLALEASEVSRLRAEAEDSKRIQAQLEEQLRVARLQNQLAPPSAMTTMANRKALVIGNDTYKSVTKLLNAREDAKAIASNLTAVGYKVTLQLDLNEKEMKAALRTFSSQVQGGDEVMFFFAGHGVQLGATNYLLPTDIGGESEAQVKDEGIQLQRILDDMTEKKAKFTLAMIDACRDNPFKSMGRNIGGRGLAPTTAATGQMVVFSAGSGQQALDRLGSTDKNKNGVFTRTFLKEMQKSGVSIDRIIKNVRNEVAELAKTIGHEQVPAIYDQVLGDFYFKK
jgi:hypothetical protein